MNNITLSKWDVMLYLSRSAHRYSVLAQDKESALKEALAIHNQERAKPISFWELEGQDITRLLAITVCPPATIPHFLGDFPNAADIEY